MLKFQLLQREVQRVTKWNEIEDAFTVQEEIEDKSLKADVEKALKAWASYLEKVRCN